MGTEAEWSKRTVAKTEFEEVVRDQLRYRLGRHVDLMLGVMGGN